MFVCLFGGQQFAEQLAEERMAFVVRDGGTNPNSGPAGQSALIREDGHSDHASKNMGEFRAAVESRPVLTPTMRILAYVKERITE
jgi:hypothetical protein